MSKLKTTVLPQFNCSNCEYFISENKKILDFGEIVYTPYAKECSNLCHPLEDCILRGFKAHSAQPGFSQTINK